MKDARGLSLVKPTCFRKAREKKNSKKNKKEIDCKKKERQQKINKNITKKQKKYKVTVTERTGELIGSS